VNIIEVLHAVRPGEAWSLSGDDYSGLEWLDDTPKPTLGELEAAWPQVESDLAWRPVRRERDRLLAASDWSQMPDNALAPAAIAAWAVYRQALRDVPQDYASPDEVVWPTAP